MYKLTNKQRLLYKHFQTTSLAPQGSPYNEDTIASLPLIKKHIPTGILVHKLYKYRNITQCLR